MQVQGLQTSELQTFRMPAIGQAFSLDATRKIIPERTFAHSFYPAIQTHPWEIKPYCKDSFSLTRLYKKAMYHIFPKVLKPVPEFLVLIAKLFFIKGVKKVRSNVKLYSFYFSNNESNDINVTAIL